MTRANRASLAFTCGCALGALGALGACTRTSPPAPVSAPVIAPVAPLSPIASSPDAPATARTHEALTFADAAWKHSACTEDTTKDGCDSEWRHAETQQLVRVFVVPIADPRAIDGFIERLGGDVVKRGGLADRIEQNGMVVLRYLEEGQAPGGVRTASVSYALVGRDKQAVHLITSVVPYDDQQQSDARLRTLMTSASWIK